VLLLGIAVLVTVAGVRGLKTPVNLSVCVGLLVLEPQFPILLQPLGLFGKLGSYLRQQGE
jgi:hypothetical protein